MEDRCIFNPSPTNVRRQGQLNFLFSTCFIDEGSVASVLLPPVVYEFLNVFSERFDRVTTTMAMGD